MRASSPSDRRFYRDRADCENNFDEYKNRWGRGGFVTRKKKTIRAMMRLVAIVVIRKIGKIPPCARSDDMVN